MTNDVQAAMEWLLESDCGLSSKALMARMLGASARPMNYPHDPADLGRCLRLLQRVPAWRARIGEMAACGKCWAALVSQWDEIASAMEAEVGIDWSKGCSAPKTYALMKSVLMPAELDGGRV